MLSCSFSIYLLFNHCHPADATHAVIRGWVYTDDRRPDEKDIKDSTPMEIRELTKKCWKRNPDDRPTSNGKL